MFYFQNDFIVQNLYSAHEEAISTCEEQGLKQAVYFLKRDLMFIKEVYQIHITINHTKSVFDNTP
jgi:hypothetical protein